MIRMCTFRLGEDAYGVVADTVIEVLRDQPYTRVPLAPAPVRGLINLRGHIVPALDLSVCLGRRPAGYDRPGTLIVLRDGDGSTAALVDEVTEVVELDDAAFAPPPPHLRGPARELVRGACPLPDRLLLLLDVDRVLRAIAGGAASS